MRWCASLGVIAALTVGAWAVPACAQDTDAMPLPLYLETFVNGVNARLIVPVQQMPDGHLWMQADELRGLGLAPDSGAQPAHGWVDLQRLEGVQSRYDEATQTLHLHARDAAMLVRQLDVQATAERPELGAPTAPSSGAFLNHTFYVSSSGTRWADAGRWQHASTLLEGTVYAHWGVLSSTQLLRLERHASGNTMDRRFRSVRLDTNWSWFDEKRLLTVSAGDFIGSSLSFSRSVRLGGVQLRRNFAIRPDLVTMPMLSTLTGSAAVPSTVELYINNAQRFAQDLPPGPFAINNLPLVTGAGTARLVVRDALGRETVSETPFYASNRLLAQGLSDFALEAGFARRNLGILSSDYDSRLLANASARYGLSNAATLEGLAQVGGGLSLAGAGGVFRLGTLGVTALSGSFSHYRPQYSRRESGSQLAASFESEWRGFSLYLRHQRTQGRFNDLASTTLDTRMLTTSAQKQLMRHNARPPLRMSQVALSLPSAPLFSDAWQSPSLSLSYTPITQSDGRRTRLWAASLGQRLPGNGWLSVATNRDLARRDSASVFVMLSWYLDNHLNASASIAQSRGSHAQSTLELSRSEQDHYGSLGWRVRSVQGVTRSVDKSQAASASYRHRYGRIEAGIEQMQSRSSGERQINARLQLDGAVVFAGGGALLANRIYDAFGVVQVGAPDVSVLFENSPVGTTNGQGQILLTGLRAYERNLVSIDPMTLPVDARIPVIQQTVSPRFKSGVLINFDVTLHPRNALVTLRDEAGTLLPVGTNVRLNDGATFVVGHDGQVWLENIAEHNRLHARHQDASGQISDCVLDFSAPQTMRERLLIDNAVCRRQP